MRNFKKIKLVSLAKNEIEKQKLSEIKGGNVAPNDIFPCACFRLTINRSQSVRRNYTGVS